MPEFSSAPSVLPATPPPRPDSWWRRRVVEPLRNILKQGLTPPQLALTVALAVPLGLVPILGITTVVATFAAVRLRLNVAATLIVSHLMSPLQLLVLIPLLRFGARLLGNGQGPELSLDQLRHLFATDWGSALSLLWRAGAGAVLLWAVLSVPVGVLLYFGLRPVFRRLLARQAAPAA
ncbi:DUF2062 domain-containing protein [Hymenobacter chitinivorans]|uniref:Uncharacterized protein DUF2062 n=1 Tax=Hymenobacter chitinivorans DSM 11115 TaxID=1121954 RepID=A0A2M9BRZ8_9BACT|nr:DUF2062 domain-containing protein [Hymenobacter chitinivorans]PJJ60723.1 uncharacterized protein DUF2062 [Hymenobacter chitinivorans DSM 11115]